jgi:hypothetical protein
MRARCLANASVLALTFCLMAAAHAESAAAAPANSSNANNSSDGTAGNVADKSADNSLHWVDSKPIDEVWLNPGLYSWHWQRDRELNNDNYGFGAEYRFSTVASFTAGEFYNSNRAISDYIGLYYQPAAIGPVRFGAALGGFNGYPNMKNGNWFLAAIPVASYDYKRVGLNLSLVPSYQNRLYGAISFQFKLKVY